MTTHKYDTQTYYIAGPMTYIKAFNFPAFDEAAEDLRAKGLRVVSPAELDSPKAREAALQSPDGNPEHYERDTSDTWGDLLSRDVKIVADGVDGIIVLPGWQRSRGARLETFVAFLCDKPIRHYPSMRKVKKRELMKAWCSSWWEER